MGITSGTDPRHQPDTATFEIVSSGFIGTMTARYTQGNIVVTKDYQEVEQLRRSSSAMEIPNEEETGPEEAPEEAAPTKENAPEATEAGLRDDLMNKDVTSFTQLKDMARKAEIPIARQGREALVKALLKGTEDGQEVADSLA